jgi:hypothetical protein
VNRQQAIEKAIEAAVLAEQELLKFEYESGFHWTALADTWANIAAQVPDASRPPMPREQFNGMSAL